jgi:hypothetical protein
MEIGDGVGRAGGHWCQFKRYSHKRHKKLISFCDLIVPFVAKYEKFPFLVVDYYANCP